MANAVEMSTMRMLVAQLNQYRHEYYNLNAPSVADNVYDYMYDEFTGVGGAYRCLHGEFAHTDGWVSCRVSITKGRTRHSPAIA